MTYVGVASPLLGESAAMRALRDEIRKAAGASVPVLIAGPPGSGKATTARAIHTAGKRTGPFVSVGGTQGVDLPRGHRGVGTIFLADIDRLRPSSQVMLLQSLRRRLFEPAREPESDPGALHLISATSIEPKVLVRTYGFRESLLRQLSGVTVTVPSLTERRKDIPVLALYFLSTVPMGHRPPGLTAAAMRRLREYSWPGNVRELHSVVRAAAVLAHGAMIDEMTVGFVLETATRGAADDMLPRYGSNAHVEGRRTPVRGPLGIRSSVVELPIESATAEFAC